MAKQTTDSDAMFLREVCGVVPPRRGFEERIKAIAARLDQMDQQEPSEAECISWAIDCGWLYRTEQSQQWRYVFEYETWDIGSKLVNLDASILADIRRRMKEADNA